MTQPYDPYHDPRHQGPPQPLPPQYGPPQGAPPPGSGQRPGYGPPQPGPGGPYPPIGYGPPAPQQRGASVGLIVGIVAGALALVLVAVVGGVWMYTSARGGSTVDGPGALADAEVLVFEGLEVGHVEVGETVAYGVFPPVGGPHYPIWQDCGVYAEPLRAEFAVHSLEHGAVWITYDASLSPGEVAGLEGLYTPGDYVIVSPLDGLPSRVVASAWGSQIRLDDPADPALAAYLREYVQNPGVPEPGAPCSGGNSESGDAVEASVAGETTTA